MKGRKIQNTEKDKEKDCNFTNSEAAAFIPST